MHIFSILTINQKIKKQTAHKYLPQSISSQKIDFKKTTCHKEIPSSVFSITEEGVEHVPFPPSQKFCDYSDQSFKICTASQVFNIGGSQRSRLDFATFSTLDSTKLLNDILRVL